MQHIDYGTYNPFAPPPPSPSPSSTPPRTGRPLPSLPIVRGRDQPFPPPRGREYPVLPLRTRTRTPTWARPTAPTPSLRRRAVGRADVYFDETLGEWRAIPPGDLEENLSGVRNLSRFQEAGEGEEGGQEDGEEEEEEVTKRGRRDSLKKLGKGLVLAIKNMGGSQEKKDRDYQERRAKLVASISAPMGTTTSGRRRR